MKKLYVLVLVALMAMTANAQVASQKVTMPVNQTKFTAPVKQAKTLNNGESVLNYAVMDANYYGAEMSVDHLWFLQTDTLGIAHFSNSNGTTYTRPWVYSLSQTFDLNSYFYDDVVGEGEVSLVNTPALNIDTFLLYCNYRRDEDMNPTVKDTLIVGIVTSNPESYSYYPSINVSTCFIKHDFNQTTGVQGGAHIFKYALGAEDVATDSTWSVIELPINLNNVTDKVWNVAITFKRGYDIGVNDTLPSDFYVLQVHSADPYYYTGDNDDVEDLMRCDNMSHGGWVWNSLVNQLGSNSYYYPSFFFDEDHFLYGMYLALSCTQCEVVNVPEIEKANPTVYPNPATNNFTVNLGNDEKANIQLFNIVGQQVYSETITGTAQVNVANLNSGVYMLKINQNGKVYTTKVIVK